MIRTITPILVLALASGCTSLQHAGSTSYTVRTVQAADGATICCELEVRDGKQYTGRNVQFQTSGSGAVLSVAEGASEAFTGQGVAAKALSVLPVTNLQEILGK